MKHFAIFFIFISSIWTYSGYSKTIVEVNGVKVSEKVFLIYASEMFGDSYFISNNEHLKEKVLDSIINSILITQKAEKLKLLKNLPREDLEAVKYLYPASYFAYHINNTSNSSAQKNDYDQFKFSEYPNYLASYYKIRFSSKEKAENTLKQLKSKHRKSDKPALLSLKKEFISLGFKHNRQSFKSLKTFVSNLDKSSPAEDEVVSSKKLGLLDKVIKTDFGFQIVFVDRIYNSKEIAILYEENVTSKWSKSNIAKAIDEQIKSSKIEINQENLRALELKSFAKSIKLP